MSDLEYLEEERIKLWAAITEQKEFIENINQNILEVKSRTPEDLATVKQNSKMSTEYKNKALKSCKQTEETIEKAKIQLQEIEEKSKEIKTLITNFNAIYNESEPKSQEIISIHDNIVDLNSEFQTQIEEIENNLKVTSSHLTKASQVHEELINKEQNCINLEKKINSFHQKTNEKYNEIKELHDEIFGYNIEDDETGEIKAVEGIKDELSKAYESLKKDLKSLNEEFKELKIDLVPRKWTFS